ncbi:MAG: hypothetical protein ACLUE8_18145 [Lachnospiraceae bacterium]
MMEGNILSAAHWCEELLALPGHSALPGIILMGEPYCVPRFGFRRGGVRHYGRLGQFSDALMVIFPLNDVFFHPWEAVESQDFEEEESWTIGAERSGCSGFNAQRT